MHFLQHKMLATCLAYSTGWYCKNGALSSSFCAFVIAYLSTTPLLGMQAFLLYLMLDSLVRHDPLPPEMKFHHAASAILTSLGILCFCDSIAPIITSLLDMEITSPFLHFGKYVHASGRDARWCLCVLLCLWIPFRILFPCRAILQLATVVSKEWSLPMFGALLATIVLVGMQIAWFWKLCVLFYEKVCEGNLTNEDLEETLGEDETVEEVREGGKCDSVES